jgi:DNA-binding CsgD family transcriptional regulator
MGRSRDIHIQESLKMLRALESRYAGTMQAERLAMLRLLKENPGYTLAEVSALLKRSRSTIERWWAAYRDGGPDALLEVQAGGGKRPLRLDSEQIRTLAGKIEREEFSSFPEIQRWLQESYGIDYTVPGIRRLVIGTLGSNCVRRLSQGRASGDAKPRHTSEDSRSSADDSFLVPRQFLSFLNALPIVGDTLTWGREFQNLLVKTFPDIDRAVVAYNTEFDLLNPDAYQPQMVFSYHLAKGTNRTSNEEVNDDYQNAAQLLEAGKRAGFPFEKYHAPYCEEYYYHDRAYLGTIILFREIDHPPISQQTLDIIAELRQFITFILAHLVMRNRYYKPMDNSFYDELMRVAREAKLGRQQLKIVTHLLFGRSYKEIADLLSIAEGTVRKHLSVIYQKTGTRSHSELFAKYFTPRVGIGLRADRPEIGE